MTGGWFAVKRGITSHPLFKGRPDRLAVWMWLLDNACWKDTPHDINGKTVTVPRGSVCVSIRRLAEEVNVSVQTVRTVLDRLRTDNIANTAVTQNRTIVSLCNWDKYQVPEKKTNTPTNKRLTRDQHIKEQGNNSDYVGSPSTSFDFAGSGDIAKQIFDGGIQLLGRAGIPQSQARSIIGRWRKENDDFEVMAAMAKAQAENALQPVEFISGCFRQQKAKPKIGDKRMHPKTGMPQEFAGATEGWMDVRQ